MVIDGNHCAQPLLKWADQKEGPRAYSIPILGCIACNKYSLSASADEPPQASLASSQEWSALLQTPDGVLLLWKYPQWCVGALCLHSNLIWLHGQKPADPKNVRQPFGRLARSERSCSQGCTDDVPSFFDKTLPDPQQVAQKAKQITRR